MEYPNSLAKDRFPPDGVLGLAFPRISHFGAYDFFSTLVDDGVVTEAVFGVKLATFGSELFLGGTNHNLFTGDFVYTPVTEVVSDVLLKERTIC
jgi:hypothetical protein